MTFKRLNNIIGWLLGIVATVVYLLTLEPTASWWDCGEYISTSYKLQVGHPPGAPLFQMIGRFFTLFAFGDTSKVAMMINAMSAICSGLTITFLFWSITLIARKIWMKDGEESPWAEKIGVLAAGFVGALAYTFTESFWFSAVEGEVYAMSSLMSALTFWAILKWDATGDETYSYRWIMLIAYLIGLSIGVHLLNLLCIPALVYVVYFKKFKKTTFWGFVLTGVISVALLGFVYLFLIPEIVNMAGKIELFFVNTLHAPFNLGTIFYFAVIIGLLVWAIIYSTKHKKVIFNTISLSLMFLLIGYSSFFMITIRANTNTPINENEPSDALSLLSYLNREQYGSNPLIYGQYYNSPFANGNDWKDGTPIYVKDTEKGRYVMTDPRKKAFPDYPDEMKTLFPRMFSNTPRHISMYESYRKDSRGIITGNPTKVRNNAGQYEIVSKPTFGQNIKFFVGYQLNWMYWRYFLWNFVGRQNDIESNGELENGNWISGINFIDSARLGDQSNKPACLDNPGETKFYFLPLILGIIGLVWFLRKDPKYSWIIFLLFVMTGIAIVVDLNQTPYQPRERDYSYAVSFYAFAMWIGLGVMALADMINSLVKRKSVIAVVAVALVCTLAVPCVMAANGWEEHNRAGKTSARDWARNYLAQLPPNSVIVTRGDNDTFPLWYVQEVEGFRTDVRVVNYMLSSGYWYVHQMGRKVYDSERLPLTLSPKQYDNGVNDHFAVLDDESPKGQRVELKTLINYMAKNPKAERTMEDGSKLLIMPTNKVKLTVDKEAALRSGFVPESMKDKIVDVIEWDISKGYHYKNDLMLLDFLASSDWERPIYFTSFSDISKTLGIDRYMHMEGLAYRFIPVPAEDYYKNIGGVYREGSFDLLVNKATWGNLNDPKVVVDRESMRNTDFAKQSYVRLAQSLINHHELDSAVMVLDKYLEFFPCEKFPYDLRMYSFPEMYYACHADEKGDAFVLDFMDICCDKIEFYSKMKEPFRSYYQETIEEQLSIIQHVGKITLRYGRNELSEEISNMLTQYSSLLTM